MIDHDRCVELSCERVYFNRRCASPEGEEFAGHCETVRLGSAEPLAALARLYRKPSEAKQRKRKEKTSNQRNGHKSRPDHIKAGAAIEGWPVENSDRGRKEKINRHAAKEQRD